MKFLRQMSAVVAVMAVVVALGFLWKNSSAASLVADDRRRPDQQTAGPNGAPKDGPKDQRFERRGAGGISLSNLDDLAQTLVVMGALVTVVIVVDRSRRKRSGRFGQRPAT